MLEVRIKEKKFDDVLFSNVNIKFPSHGIVGIFGESGSGKSTLLNIIACLDENYDGEVLLNGKNVLNRKELFLKNYISYCFQSSFLMKDLKVKDFFKLSRLLGYSNIDSDLYQSQYIKTLSGGQKQRIALAMALGKNAPISLLDEITSGLDHANKIDVMDEIKNFSKNHLVIIVSHDKELLEGYADYMIELCSNIHIDLSDEPIMNNRIIKRKNKLGMFLYKYKFFQYLLLFISTICIVLTLFVFRLFIFDIADTLNKQILDLYPKDSYSFISDGFSVEDTSELLEKHHVYYCLEDAYLLGIKSGKNHDYIVDDYMKEVPEVLLEGGYPINDDELIIGKKIADVLNININDSIMLCYDINSNKVDVPFKVVGIDDSNCIYFKELGEFSYLNRIYNISSKVAMVTYSNQDEVLDFFNEHHYEYKQVGKSMAKKIQDSINKLTMIFTVLGSVCLFICVIFISELLLVNIEEKEKMIAFFRLNGLSKKELFLLLYRFYLFIFLLAVVLCNVFYYLVYLLSNEILGVSNIFYDYSFVLLNVFVVILFSVLIFYYLYKVLKKDVLAILKSISI